MSNFVERLNFADKSDRSDAIEISKTRDVNHFETLCQYCANNDIDLSVVSEEEFEAAAEVMSGYGSADKSTESYFFWID